MTVLTNARHLILILLALRGLLMISLLQYEMLRMFIGTNSKWTDYKCNRTTTYTRLEEFNLIVGGTRFHFESHASWSGDKVRGTRRC